MKFKSYNSELHLSDYALGTTYAFYIRDHDITRLEKANSELVREYGSLIDEITDNQEYSRADGRWLIFTRAFGVVVGKTSNGTMDFITVMFGTIDGDYVLAHYAVGLPGVFTNDKDATCPAAILGL